MRRGVALFLLMVAAAAQAAQWSTTEIQYQRGRLAAPTFAGGARADTSIVTLQHASGFKRGDVFCFVDYLDDPNDDGFNERDLYGEVYVNLSLGKMTGKRVGRGALADIGVILGANAASQARVRKWLPGLRLSWKAKGFAFLNTDFTAYLDDSAGLGGGGAPRESDSFMVDVSWARPIAVGKQAFSIEGHAELIGARRDELGHDVSSWVLAQPQFRYDLGKGLAKAPDHVFIGIEWQYWRNKLGDGKTDESAVQALLVWRF